MKFKEAVQLFVGVIVLLAIIMAILGVSAETIDKIISLIIPMGMSLIFSALAGAIIEGFSGDTLKKILLVVEIYGFHISITLFTIATILLKIWLF